MPHVQTSAHISRLGIPNATDAHLSRLGCTESRAHVTSLGPVISQLNNTQRDHVTSLGQAKLPRTIHQSTRKRQSPEKGLPSLRRTCNRNFTRKEAPCCPLPMSVAHTQIHIWSKRKTCLRIRTYPRSTRPRRPSPRLYTSQRLRHRTRPARYHYPEQPNKHKRPPCTINTRHTNPILQYRQK